MIWPERLIQPESNLAFSAIPRPEVVIAKVSINVILQLNDIKIVVAKEQVALNDYVTENRSSYLGC